jgi:hypothetical protein
MRQFTEEEEENIRFIYEEILDIMNDSNVEFDIALGAAKYLWEITDEMEEELYKMFSEEK